MISILSLDNVGAEQFGLFTYGEVDGTVEITGFPEDLEIHVDIPAEIVLRGRFAFASLSPPSYD